MNLVPLLTAPLAFLFVTRYPGDRQRRRLHVRAKVLPGRSTLQ
jgi:hypothetical protein